MSAVCTMPGCEKLVAYRGQKFCGKACKMAFAEQRRDENHMRAMFESAASAPKAECCRDCPPAYTYVDEDGDQTCACARRVA